MSKEQQPPEFAISIPEEVVTSPNGKQSVRLGIISSSEEAAEVLKRHIVEQHGGKLTRIDPSEKKFS